jgi:hypothetical protein
MKVNPKYLGREREYEKIDDEYAKAVEQYRDHPTLENLGIKTDTKKKLDNIKRILDSTSAWING